MGTSVILIYPAKTIPPGFDKSINQIPCPEAICIVGAYVIGSGKIGCVGLSRSYQKIGEQRFEYMLVWPC